MLKYKLDVMLNYFGVNFKTYGTFPTYCTYDSNDPLNYYLSQSHRAFFDGPYDELGIPLFRYKDRLEYYPIFISMYALGHLENGRKIKNEREIDIFRKISDYFISHQDQNGRWMTLPPVKKFGIRGPWPSAMAQGLVISCLVRAYRLFNDNRYYDAAIKAIEPYKKDHSEGGVASQHDGDLYFEEYPSSHKSRVLNGFIFAIWGLRDIMLLSDDNDVRKLYNEGMSTLKKVISNYDIGYWSLYNLSDGLKNPATVPYHKLHIRQLEVLYAITQIDMFDYYRNLWTDYLSNRINALRTLPSKLLWIITHL